LLLWPAGTPRPMNSLGLRIGSNPQPHKTWLILPCESWRSELCWAAETLSTSRAWALLHTHPGSSTRQSNLSPTCQFKRVTGLHEAVDMDLANTLSRSHAAGQQARP
jgi:hypothetical protein